MTTMSKHPKPVFAGPTLASLYAPLSEREVAIRRPARTLRRRLADVVRGESSRARIYRGSSTNSRMSRDVRAR
jgi:hypothetical protein